MPEANVEPDRCPFCSSAIALEPIDVPVALIAEAQPHYFTHRRFYAWSCLTWQTHHGSGDYPIRKEEA